MSSFKMRAHPRSNIREVFVEKESIHLDPVYQRISGLWDDRKQQLLIDSIINGFDLPKLYIHDLIPPKVIEGRSYRYAIIDGKQRLLAIWRFMDDRLELADDFRLFDDPGVRAAGATYSDLARNFPHLRAQFDKTDLPIVIMQSDDDELVEALFSRLNEAVPLTAPEYRNTLGGPIPPLLRRLQAHQFFQRCVPFESKRYRYLDIAAKFVFLLYRNKFVSTKKKDLDDLVRDFRRGHEQGEAWASDDAVRNLGARCEAILNQMDAFFTNNDHLLDNAGWITLFFHMFRLMEGRRPPRKLTRSMFASFMENLSETRTILRKITQGVNIGRRRPDPVLQQFVNLGQSSNDGSAILGRYRIVRRYFSDKFGVDLPAPVE